ncbi:hypothetical protein [Streptomyces zagrosensis]|uniref:Uncharacterized protein n=1 Tax=Streptomyces zagrosensis TaxID=1042984 RepID=A0A7W9V2J2_9ACTN|nr:hypothetical protein [Streptomyces zagrosensis]MBB5938909.1 hypothetical protein [Streptomyces zagrosensis]
MKGSADRARTAHGERSAEGNAACAGRQPGGGDVAERPGARGAVVREWVRASHHSPPFLHVVEGRAARHAYHVVPASPSPNVARFALSVQSDPPTWFVLSAQLELGSV